MRPNPNHVGDPLFLPQLLTAFGVKVVEFDSWRDRGQGDFNKIWGVLAHHTGSDNARPTEIAFGVPNLKGLLSQIYLGRDGVATIVGAGVAWHAGIGSWPGLQNNNANPVTIGIEAASSGTSPWPPVMLDSYHRICAAICWYLGHSSLRTIGHKEWAKIQGKWDPGGIDMNQFRARVQFYINNPPFMPPPPPPQLPPNFEGEDMAFWDDRVPSLVDNKLSFPRKDYLQLIDYHATLADIQSRSVMEQNKQILAEMKLVRDDLQRLAEAIVKDKA